MMTEMNDIFARDHSISCVRIRGVRNVSFLEHLAYLLNELSQNRVDITVTGETKICSQFPDSQACTQCYQTTNRLIKILDTYYLDISS